MESLSERRICPPESALSYDIPHQRGRQVPSRMHGRIFIAFSVCILMAVWVVNPHFVMQAVTSSVIDIFEMLVRGATRGDDL